MIIGESYAHDQLNAATHDALHEMFGVTNLKTFNHIALTIEKGQVVDVDGNDVYLPHIERLKIPISFIPGRPQHAVLPGEHAEDVPSPV